MRLILGRLAVIHCLAQIPICFCKPFQMNSLAISFLVVCMEEFARPWIESNIWCLKLAGTIGRALLVDVPHSKRDVLYL